MRAARAIFTSAAVRTTKRLVVPLAIALVASALCIDTAAAPLQTAGLTATTASASWLHLPALLLTAFALLIAVDDWPPIARDRDDAAWVRRHLAPAFRGSVAHGTGVLTALALSLAVLGVGFAFLLEVRGKAEPPREFVAFVQPDGVESAELAPSQDRVVLVPAPHTAGSVFADRLVLRALPVRPPGGDLLTPLRLEVWCDGERVGEPGRAAEILSFADRVEVRFEPRVLQRVEVRRAAPSESSESDEILGALFPPRAVEGVLAIPRSSIVNFTVAAWSYLVAAVCALALVVAFLGQLSTVVVTALVLGSLIGLTLFEGTPQIAAIRACAEGRWLGVEPLRARVVAPLAASAGLLLFRAVLTTGRRARSAMVRS